MQAPLAQVQVWTNLQCANGVPKAFVQHVVGATGQLRLRGDSRVTIDLPLSDAAIAEVTAGRVLRLLYTDGTWNEWRIDRLTTEAGPGGEVRRCQCAAPLFELGATGPITEYDPQGVPSFAGSRTGITPSDVITTVVLPWLIAQGVTWVDVGTVDPTAPLDIDWDTVTPLGLLHQLEELTKCELALRPNGTSEYLIDLLQAVNSAAPIADLRAGKNLTAVALTEDATQRFSALTALGAADPAGRRAVLGRAVWEVAAVDTVNDRLTLTDPEGRDDPILEDDQFNGLYLYDAASGTTDQILDTVAATQEVAVADASLYVVGALLEVRAGAGSGTPTDNAPLLTTLSRPSVTPIRVGQLDRPDLPGERNLLRNGWFGDWAGGAHAAPDGWTLHTGALAYDLRDSTYAELGPDAVQLRFAPWQVSNTPLTTGQDTVTGIDGGYFHVGQSVNVSGYAGSVETRTVIAKTATTIQLSAGVGYDHALGTYVSVTGASFPIIDATLSQGFPGLVSDRVRAPVSGGGIFWAQAKLLLLGFPAGQYRAVLTLERYNASDILLGAVPSETTVLDQWVTLGASVQPSAGEYLRVRVEVKTDPTYAGVVPTYQRPSTARLLIDGAAITQTDYRPTGIPNYSFGNALWQATNRALQQSAGSSYEVQLVDLTAVDPAGWPHDALALGGTVRVNDHRTGIVQQLLRIVELSRPNLFRPGECTVVLNARRLDLTEIIDRALSGAKGGGTPAPGGSGGTGGTPPSMALIPVKIPFHASGDAGTPVPLTLGAHGATETEVDTGLRCFVDFAGSVKCCVETVVDTIGHTTAALVAKYSTDQGTTWNYLDAVDAPSVLLQALGLRKGTEIRPIPGGEVWVGLFMRGGNSTASPVVRNTFLAVWYAVLAAPVPRPAAPVQFPVVGCSVPGGIRTEEDFAGYGGTYADFINARAQNADGTGLFADFYAYYASGSSPSADSYLDTTDLFNGGAALVHKYDNSALGGATGFWTDFDDGAGTPTRYDTIAVFEVFEIESGFTYTGAGTGTGLQIARLETNQIAGSPSFGRNEAAVWLRDGRIYFEWFQSYVSTVVVDIDDAANWIGQKKQFVLSLERLNATDIAVQVSIDDPCTATPAVVHSATYTAFGATNQWDVWEHRGGYLLTGGPATAKTFKLWQVAYDDDPSTFGL